MTLSLQPASAADLQRVEALVAQTGWIVIMQSIRNELAYLRWVVGDAGVRDDGAVKLTQPQMDAAVRIRKLKSTLEVLETITRTQEPQLYGKVTITNAE